MDLVKVKMCGVKQVRKTFLKAITMGERGQNPVWTEPSLDRTQWVEARRNDGRTVSTRVSSCEETRSCWRAVDQWCVSSIWSNF